MHLDAITLRTDEMAVAVAPMHGGRIAQIEAFGTPLLIGHDSPDATEISWGAFPMVPWAGRIRDGAFMFRGRNVQLPRNMGDHAIHGTGYVSEWTVTHRGDSAVELELSLPDDERWPFGGTARQRIRVDAATVTSTLSVTAGCQEMPVSLGWHPWFRKPSRFEFHPEAMYRRDDHHIAVAETIAVPPGPWDDCFVNRRPVRMMIDHVEITMRSSCTHWVVYDVPAHATCVEPQTGPPDALNIAPFVVPAGSTVTASYQLSGAKA